MSTKILSVKCIAKGQTLIRTERNNTVSEKLICEIDQIPERPNQTQIVNRSIQAHGHILEK